MRTEVLAVSAPGRVELDKGVLVVLQQAVKVVVRADKDALVLGDVGRKGAGGQRDNGEESKAEHGGGREKERERERKGRVNKGKVKKVGEEEKTMFATCRPFPSSFPTFSPRPETSAGRAALQAAGARPSPARGPGRAPRL